jgi:hypothetical protein
MPAMHLRRLCLNLLALATVLVLPACRDDVLDAECNLIVLNQSSCSLSIFVDGQEAFAVRPGSDRTLDDIGPGRHVLEAVDSQGKLIVRRPIELATGEDFYWTLDHC